MANIGTITPFSDAVLDKVIAMAKRGTDPSEIEKMVREDLAKFNAKILENQDTKLAMEVVERLFRGQTIDEMCKEPHMPKESIIRAAIANCPEANERLLAMNRITQGSIANRTQDALDEIGKIAMKKKPSEAETAQHKLLSDYLKVVRVYMRDRLIVSIERKEQSKVGVSQMIRGEQEAIDAKVPN